MAHGSTCVRVVLLYTAHFVELVLILIFAFYHFVADAAQPIVSGEPWTDLGTATTLRCTASDTFELLEWRNSTFGEMGFDMAGILVRFTVASDQVLNRDDSHYLFDKNDPGYPLTITPVTLDDEARYWCSLESDLVRRRFIDKQVRGE